MDYICTKKMSVGGKTYAPGEKIPGAVFLGGRVNKLVAYGYISEVEGKKPAQDPVGEPVEAADETEKAEDEVEKTEDEAEKAEAPQPTAAKPKKAASGDKK